MIANEKELIKAQITKSHNEILFIKFIFVFVNCLSLVLIGLILEKLYTSTETKNEEYIKIFEASLAAFAPYITFVAQGYCYPRLRKINILRFLLFKTKLEDEDIKSIYDK